MTSILYSWPWSICLSTCGIKYGGGNIQLFTLAQEKVNASMPSAQGFKPVTAETRDLACLEGREPVDSVGPPQNIQGCKNIWVKDVVIIVHLSRQACSFGRGLPTLRMFSMLMLSVLWHTVFPQSFSATDRSTSLTPLSSLQLPDILVPAMLTQ